MTLNIPCLITNTYSYDERCNYFVKANLSLQLLTLAERLSRNREQFALYMTDVTPVSFAVDARAHVRLVDLSAVLVVDKLAVEDGMCIVKFIFFWQIKLRKRKLHIFCDQRTSFNTIYYLCGLGPYTQYLETTMDQ